jgi:hypothetical protein
MIEWLVVVLGAGRRHPHLADGARAECTGGHWHQETGRESRPKQARKAPVRAAPGTPPRSQGPPNMRVQRTRRPSLRSGRSRCSLGSPLTRYPLGGAAKKGSLPLHTSQT